MATNLQFIKSASGSSVTELDITDIFTSNYEVYKLTIPTWNSGSSGQELNLRFLDSGGTVISASEYDYAVQTTRAYDVFQELKLTSDTRVHYIGYNDADTVGFGSEIYIHNPFNSSSYTFTQWQTSSRAPSGHLGYKGIAVHKSAEQLSGVRFYGSGVWTFSNLEVNVFGVK